MFSEAEAKNGRSFDISAADIDKMDAQGLGRSVQGPGPNEREMVREINARYGVLIMNSNKKLGILATLLVIFIFLFVMGKLPDKLPSFQTVTDANDPAQTLMNPQDSPPGLTARERLAQQNADQFQRVSQQEVTSVERQRPQYEDAFTNAEVRIILPMPESLGPAMPPVELAEVQEKPQLVLLPAPAWPKAYVVESGDNLALIAKRFYGPVEGNRFSTIGKLFAANRRVLRTPNNLQVGQKIVIPPLNPLASKALEEVTVPVKSIGGSRLGQGQATPVKLQPKDQWYVVRNGDSLWRIASSRLGNGRLYREIAKLNSNAIKNKDHLPVGLRLRLPVL
jgi:nucleoid-associated protein YgaU